MKNKKYLFCACIVFISFNLLASQLNNSNPFRGIKKQAEDMKRHVKRDEVSYKKHEIYFLIDTAGNKCRVIKRLRISQETQNDQLVSVNDYARRPYLQRKAWLNAAILPEGNKSKDVKQKKQSTEQPNTLNKVLSDKQVKQRKLAELALSLKKSVNSKCGALWDQWPARKKLIEDAIAKGKLHPDCIAYRQTSFGERDLSPLGDALRNNDRAFATFLENHRARLKEGEADNILEEVTGKGERWRLVRLCLEYGANPNGMGKDNMTPLLRLENSFSAINSSIPGLEESIRYLLRYGAKLDLKSPKIAQASFPRRIGGRLRDFRSRDHYDSNDTYHEMGGGPQRLNLAERMLEAERRAQERKTLIDGAIRFLSAVRIAAKDEWDKKRPYHVASAGNQVTAVCSLLSPLAQKIGEYAVPDYETLENEPVETD